MIPVTVIYANRDVAGSILRTRNHKSERVQTVNGSLKLHLVRWTVSPERICLRKIGSTPQGDPAAGVRVVADPAIVGMVLHRPVFRVIVEPRLLVIVIDEVERDSLCICERSARRRCADLRYILAVCTIGDIGVSAELLQTADAALSVYCVRMSCCRGVRKFMIGRVNKRSAYGTNLIFRTGCSRTGRMRNRRNRFLCDSNRAALRALLAFRQTGFSTGRRYCGKRYILRMLMRYIGVRKAVVVIRSRRA